MTANDRRPLEVQGHRGARGLAPENTLAGFEIALDVGVTSIETDVHLTCDDVAVLFHDARITESKCVALDSNEVIPVASRPLVRSLTLAQLRGYRVHGPAPAVTPLAQRFADARGIDPCGIPTLAELFDFIADYAAESSGKTQHQRERANRVVLDLELKRVPFFPETIGDGFLGSVPELLERQVVQAIRDAGALSRTRARSFDHRSMKAIRQLAPTLPVGLLIFETVPAHIGKLLEGAEFYCPDFNFVDAEVVRQVHEAGKRIIPYTVNDPDHWSRLIAWGVDGITTDFPDRLLAWCAERSVAIS